MGRVRIGTCSGPAEAALVRAAFAAHEIPIVINAEQHASMLGGLGGVFVPLHVYVDDEHAEEAAALWKDLRDHESSEAELDAAADAAGETEADTAGEAEPAAAGEAGPAAAEDEASDELPIEVRTERRRRTVAVFLLGCCVTFGTAHLLTGAKLRGLVLAAIEAFAIRCMFVGHLSFGSFLLFACIATDVIGSMLRIHTSKPLIPSARIHR
jgi:hypothetical protein